LTIRLGRTSKCDDSNVERQLFINSLQAELNRILNHYSSACLPVIFSHSKRVHDEAIRSVLNTGRLSDVDVGKAECCNVLPKDYDSNDTSRLYYSSGVAPCDNNDNILWRGDDRDHY
jgi:hypothetical protein